MKRSNRVPLAEDKAATIKIHTVLPKWWPHQAQCVLGFFLAKKGINLPLSRVRHEYIHRMQQRELLFIGAYLIYFVELLLKICIFKGNLKERVKKAYHSISLEREAEYYQNDPSYLSNRPRFNFILFF